MAFLFDCLITAIRLWSLLRSRMSQHLVADAKIQVQDSFLLQLVKVNCQLSAGDFLNRSSAVGLMKNPRTRL